jgi:hypothetical protein
MSFAHRQAEHVPGSGFLAAARNLKCAVRRLLAKDRERPFET